MGLGAHVCSSGRASSSSRSRTSSLQPIGGRESCGVHGPRQDSRPRSSGDLYGLKKASAEIVTHGRIVFPVGDNLSSILAYEKGRARCEDLIAQCRQAAGYIIGAQIRWHHRHIESERNVADHDSRAADRGARSPSRTSSIRLRHAARSNRFSASSTREVVAPFFIAPNGHPWPPRRRRPSRR